MDSYLSAILRVDIQRKTPSSTDCLRLVTLSLVLMIVSAKTFPRTRRSLDDVCKCNDPYPECQDVPIQQRDCSLVTGYESECEHLSDLFNNPYTGPAKCAELQSLKWCISGG